MADVVVVGAGLAGLATAARLAKLGHQVTVCERATAPGGLLAQVEHAGLRWDLTPMQTTIPAVLRDLFRKSGRPLERYIDLELSTPARRHVFADGTTLDLPTGSRGAQLEAVGEALGRAAGEAWTQFVDGQDDVWALLRSDVLDVPDGAVGLTDRRLSRALGVKKSLDHLVRKAFDDTRLRELARFPALRTAGGNPQVPAFGAVEPYVERVFGVWRAPGGAADLAQGLMQRMGERSVDVRFDTPVACLWTRSDQVTGVQLDDGSRIEADLVVTTVSPRQVFGHLLDHPAGHDAVPLFTQATAPRSGVTYLGLTGEPPALPAEVVLHGDPLVTVHTDGPVTDGGRAWTVVTHGPGPLDPLDVMAERGLDVRQLVTTRLDMPGPTPAPPWTGASDAAARAALAHPLPGLHCLSTGLVLGGSIPYVAWQAAHVAELIGRA